MTKAERLLAKNIESRDALWEADIVNELRRLAPMEAKLAAANAMHHDEQLHSAQISKGLDKALARVKELESALNAMLTQFGMDEDEQNKATFNQARKALGETK